MCGGIEFHTEDEVTRRLSNGQVVNLTNWDGSFDRFNDVKTVEVIDEDFAEAYGGTQMPLAVVTEGKHKGELIVLYVYKHDSDIDPSVSRIEGDNGPGDANIGVFYDE